MRHRAVAARAPGVPRIGSSSALVAAREVVGGIRGLIQFAVSALTNQAPRGQAFADSSPARPQRAPAKVMLSEGAAALPPAHENGLPMAAGPNRRIAASQQPMHRLERMARVPELPLSVSEMNVLARVKREGKIRAVHFSRRARHCSTFHGP